MLKKMTIEIKIYPNNDIIYIDFAYQGIPEELNIKEIKIREKPTEKVDEGIDLVEDITDDYQLVNLPCTR